MPSDNEDKLKDDRPVCKYGDKCYQKNPFHLSKYKHVKPEVKPDKKRKNETDEEENIKKTKLNLEELEKEMEDDSFFDDKVIDKIDETINIGLTLDDPSTSASSVGTEATKTPRELIKTHFLVDMPEDFYDFWNFMSKLNEKDPVNALKPVDLKLVGPFDVLAGNITNDTKLSPDKYLIHWRYYYDPPEFQTVLKGSDQTGFHIGYFRDEPDKSPVFMVSNAAALGGTLSKMGENIFAATYLYLNDYKLSADPFKKMQIEKFLVKIKAEADRLKLDVSKKTSNMRMRDGNIVCSTFNKIGLVVPINKKTKIGYRELAMENKELQELFKKMRKALPEQLPNLRDQLQPVLTYATIANDECDFGTSIELGWNIISAGVDSLNQTAALFLSTSYSLLGRDTFGIIATAHMAKRRKGCNLSVLEN